MDRLPIELIPNSQPPRFRWRVRVDVNGPRSMEMEGPLPSGVDAAVIELLAVVKQLQVENADLRKKLEGFAERIAGQSEILSKHAEAKAVVEASKPVLAAKSLPVIKMKG